MTGELILIVDDEINIIDLARLYLEREGYKTEAAMDGTEALRLTCGTWPLSHYPRYHASWCGWI